MRFSKALFIVALAAALPAGAYAQSAVDLAALQGLLPFSVLLDTAGGKAVLARNYAVTRAIQTGHSSQPALESVALQREQALKDAFITGGNARQLADGLGTKLDVAYRSLTTYTSTDDGKTSSFTSISSNVEKLIGYTSALTGADSTSGKYFFANETVMTASGLAPVSREAADLLVAVRGMTDVFGKAYHHPANVAPDPYGDSRPFQTEHAFVYYKGIDYFGVRSGNGAYLSGPTQNLTKSPAFPSGHTTYGYTESLLLAIMLPERFSQMIARAAEYGNSRIVLGAHYALDVIAGRTLASYDVAHLLASDPTYLGLTFGQYTVTDYRAVFAAAKADVRRALASKCGHTIAMCARDDTRSRFHDLARDEAFYESTQTYGLPIVYPLTAQHAEDVAALAPEAGYLLTAAFPRLTLAQADCILTETEGPGGGFLDNGSSFGVYSRLDLYKAGRKAAALAASTTHDPCSRR